MCGLALNLAYQREIGLPFNDAHDGLPVALVNDSVRFPVSDPAACVNNRVRSSMERRLGIQLAQTVAQFEQHHTAIEM